MRRRVFAPPSLASRDRGETYAPFRGWRFAEESFVEGCAERGTCPPLFTAFIATPKLGGFPRAPTPRWRFASWRSEIGNELHEGTKSEPLRRNHREGAPQQTKCCLGGSDAAQQGKHRGRPRCLPLETRAGGMFCVLLDLQRSSPKQNSLHLR